MFYEFLFQLVLDGTKERLKQFISQKIIKLGVNQYSQAFKMKKKFVLKLSTIYYWKNSMKIQKVLIYTSINYTILSNWT